MRMNSNLFGRKILRIILCLFLVLGIIACENSGAQEELQAAKKEFAADANVVDTMFLALGQFSHEIISNGNLRAVQRADLAFKNNGMVFKVYKKDGDYVKKGDTIVVLEMQDVLHKYEQACIDMEKAELDFADKLLGFGYGKEAKEIPADIERVADIRSGYSSAKHALASAKMDVDNASLRAPFNGVVANLNVRPYGTCSENVCSVIDNSAFDVEFRLLESELNYVKVGQSIRVVPYIGLLESYNGKIKQINPIIDENGQVKVVASIANKGGKLIEGMNVKIFIESISESRLTVPKSAVVVRDGYDVLFTLNKNGNIAQWVYVDILESNSTHHVVCGNKQKNAVLNVGETVIVNGNLNLAEGSKVEIKK